MMRRIYLFCAAFSMATIAVLIGTGFEDVEYTQPAAMLKENGHLMTHIGLTVGNLVRGKRRSAEIIIEQDAESADPEDFDALFIPGGHSPDHLRAHDDAVRFVARFAESKKPIFAICHGPQLLISAECVRGVRMTGWKSILIDLKNAGAIVADEPLVHDKQFFTSRGPADLFEFISAMQKTLASA